MIRRYIASALIIFFLAYSAYLIATDGGKNELVTFQKLNENIKYKFNVLIGKEESRETDFERDQQDKLDALAEKMRLEKAAEDAKTAPDLVAILSGAGGAGGSGGANHNSASGTANPSHGTPGADNPPHGTPGAGNHPSHGHPAS